MQEPITISTQKPENPAFDYGALREVGIEHIEQTASAIWTDYNIHDPGITSLELLCYAITDLSYRANYSIPDLLAAKENTVQNTREQFFSAEQIFPNRAVTLDDYRKLLIDIEGIQNAWLKKRSQPIFADITHKKLTYLQPQSRKWETVAINGYYDVLLEYDVEIQEGEKAVIKDKTRALLMANRNLCEDFINIDEVAKQEFRICTEIEMSSGANPFDTLAQMLFNIQLYLTPLIRFYSLKQLLDENISADKIFEGPLLEHGFIKEDELKASELKTELHLSDIMEAILEVNGVTNILSIVFNPVDQTDELKNKWIINVKSGMQPVLNVLESNVLIYKDGIPFRPDLSNSGQVKMKFDSLMFNYITGNDLVRTEDISYPMGNFQNVEAYSSIQNDYPKNYGIGYWGLPANATDERKIQAKQLQAYLLFFDQQLANYLSQLAHLRNLFSLQNEQQTYFTQPIDTIKHLEDLYKDKNTFANSIQSSAEIPSSDAYFKRRNLFLDHLLSRFAESFFDYVNILQFVFPDTDPQATVDTKIQFLKNYPQYSSQRFAAYDYTNTTALWDTDNISGLEKRLERLLGFKNIQRRNLVNVYSAIQQKLDENNKQVFWFEIIDNRSNQILLKSKETFDSEEEASGSLETVFELLNSPVNFSVFKDETQQGFMYQLKDKNGTVVGTSNDVFASNELAQTAINNLVILMTENQAEEGMFVIEHVLLFEQMDTSVPTSPVSSPPEPLTDEGLLPICVDDNCEECSDIDPYSFRISIVLPAYAKRFLNMDFRRYCERVIRTETPAHIFPKICWVDNEDLREFEIAYQDWLEVKAGIKEDVNQTIVIRFINILTMLKTVYPKARLEDCSSTEERKLFLLNQNVLGSLKT